MKAVLNPGQLHELRRHIAVDQLLDTIVHDEPNQAAAYWMDIYRDRTAAVIVEKVPDSRA